MVYHHRSSLLTNQVIFLFAEMFTYDRNATRQYNMSDFCESLHTKQQQKVLTFSRFRGDKNCNV